MYGKSIELFLVNGTADGLITAELSNITNSCCIKEKSLSKRANKLKESK